MLAGLALAAIILVANLAVSHRSRLIGVAVLLLPQFYLPGLPISAAVLWTLITCLAGIATRGRPMAGSPLFSIAALFRVRASGLVAMGASIWIVCRDCQCRFQYSLRVVAPRGNCAS